MLHILKCAPVPKKVDEQFIKPAISGDCLRGTCHFTTRDDSSGPWSLDGDCVDLDVMSMWCVCFLVFLVLILELGQTFYWITSQCYLLNGKIRNTYFMAWNFSNPSWSWEKQILVLKTMKAMVNLVSHIHDRCMFVFLRSKGTVAW